MGAALGRLVATEALACVIDLSELGSNAARRRFMAAFSEALYEANKEVLVLSESVPRRSGINVGSVFYFLLVGLVFPAHTAQGEDRCWCRAGVSCCGGGREHKGHDKPRPAAGDDRHFRKDRPRPDSSLPAPGPPAPPLQVNSSPAVAKFTGVAGEPTPRESASSRSRAHPATRGRSAHQISNPRLRPGSSGYCQQRWIARTDRISPMHSRHSRRHCHLRSVGAVEASAQRCPRSARDNLRTKLEIMERAPLLRPTCDLLHWRLGAEGYPVALA